MFSSFLEILVIVLGATTGLLSFKGDFRPTGSKVIGLVIIGFVASLTLGTGLSWAMDNWAGLPLFFEGYCCAILLAHLLES